VIDVIVSADSHVEEPVDLWTTRVAPQFRDAAPVFPAAQAGRGLPAAAGGHDPHARIKEMEVDGPPPRCFIRTLMLGLFALHDVRLQPSVLPVYNDWLVEYWQRRAAPAHRYAAISVYDIDHAVAELERCRKQGLRARSSGRRRHPRSAVFIRRTTRSSGAAQDLAMPVSMHILTGHSYHSRERRASEHYRAA